jgi:phenylpropionate dioxygenase-like ring-hydroxylating dioxygenase large terminal subunit
MLSQADNQRLTKVGAGTPMGEMLREIWTPAVRSASLVADGAPKPFRLLGENLVAFRSNSGAVGVFARSCPHRCASLALARNEGNGLRCIFHGWKIDVSGKVVDVPTEPLERREAFAADKLPGARSRWDGLDLHEPAKAAT